MNLIKLENGDRLHVTPRRERQFRAMLRHSGVNDTLEEALVGARRLDPSSLSRTRFFSRTGKGSYTILTAPLRLNGKRIFTLLRIVPRRRPFSSELEVKDEVQAVVSWDSKVYRIRTRKGDHPIGKVGKPGIYLVERDRKPLYVGIVHKKGSSIGQRWKCRIDTFRQLKVPSVTERKYTIRVGMIKGKGTWHRRIRKDLYESVERVLIRYLKKVRGYGLSNTKSVLPFVVASRGISIENQGTRPSYLPREINRRAGQTLELDEQPDFYLKVG